MRTRTNWLEPQILVLVLAAAAGLATLPASAAPDTSLKEAMKKMQAGVLNGDAKSLSPIFAAAKAKAKPEFPNWASLADTGKAAADKGDLEAAKAVCKQCHDAYRNDYRTKYGSKAP